MQCTFKKGFEILKQEIIDDPNKQIKHLIKFDDKLVFIKGEYSNIDGRDHLYCKYLHPCNKKKLCENEGIYFQEKWSFEVKQRDLKYEYIIRIDDSERYKLSEPIVLLKEEEFDGVKKNQTIYHNGFYGNCKNVGLSFAGSGLIGFLPDTYVPMLKGESNYTEYRKGRWDKVYGYTKYNIVCEEWIKEFIIEKHTKI